jgi:hypothetical protein
MQVRGGADDGLAQAQAQVKDKQCLLMSASGAAAQRYI